MAKSLTEDERRIISRIGYEPYHWVRIRVPELMKQWDDEFYDLVDVLKDIWRQVRKDRISLAFILKWEISDSGSRLTTIHDISNLQKKQNLSNSTLIFEIDLAGNIVDEIDFGEEIDPVGVAQLSRQRNNLIFWFGLDFEVFLIGERWLPKNKQEILRDIKSKKREQLLSMSDHKEVLRLHFERYLRDESRDSYWFIRNKLLQPTPEKIFQKSLYGFLTAEVDCIADKEPMFKDGSRCDVRIFLDNNDMYFVEIKWIGKSVVRTNDNIINPKNMHEFSKDRAIDGAYQTKEYIEKNNDLIFDHRVKLGIYLLYDAYPKPLIPINYGDEIRKCALLDIVEYSLISYPPSVKTKGIAKRKGLVK